MIIALATALETFGARLKAVRTAKGLLQKDVADMIGIEANSLARLERGEQGVRWAVMEEIFNKLGEPPAYYFSEDRAPTPLKIDPLRELIRILPALDDAKTEEVLTFIHSRFLSPPADPVPPLDDIEGIKARPNKSEG